MKSILSKIRSAIAAKLAKEPAVIAGVLAGAVVLAAGHFGVILDTPTVTSVLTPIVLGVLIRIKVTPAKSA